MQIKHFYAALKGQMLEGEKRAKVWEKGTDFDPNAWCKGKKQ